MISVPRAAVSVLAFLFGVFQLCLGAFWISKYDQPIYGVVALLCFLVLYVPTILLFKGIQIPQWVAALNFAFASVMPAVVHLHLSKEFHGTYATWHIGAIGILLGATALAQFASGRTETVEAVAKNELPDELRMLHKAVGAASERLIVTAVESEDAQVSTFMRSMFGVVPETEDFIKPQYTDRKSVV